MEASETCNCVMLCRLTGDAQQQQAFLAIELPVKIGARHLGQGNGIAVRSPRSRIHILPSGRCGRRGSFLLNSKSCCSCCSLLALNMSQGCCWDGGLPGRERRWCWQGGRRYCGRWMIKVPCKQTRVLRPFSYHVGSKFDSHCQSMLPCAWFATAIGAPQDMQGHHRCCALC